MAQEDTQEGHHQARECRGILEQDGEQARVLAVMDGGSVRFPFLVLRKALQATLNENDSKTMPQQARCS